MLLLGLLKDDGICLRNKEKTKQESKYGLLAVSASSSHSPLLSTAPSLKIKDRKRR